MTTKHPKISVVIPTYNRCELLREALDSLDGQTLSADDFETIVIDDGSTDGTSEVCGSSGLSIPVRYVRQENSGSSAAKNLGLFLSRAPLVFFFDDDDVAAPEMLAEHINAHMVHAGERTAILGFTDWHESLEVTPVMDYLVNVGQFMFSYPSIREEDRLDWKNFWTGRISCKRAMLVNLEIFSPTMKRLEDVELGYRLQRHGLEVRFWPRAISFMNRPLTYRQFCARIENDGHWLQEFRERHPADEVVAYCTPPPPDDPGSLDRDLEKIAQAVDVMEALIGDSWRSASTQPLLTGLHALYRRGFFGHSYRGTIASAERASAVTGEMTAV